MPHEVIMPALGMAQDSGLIVSWLKQPGDAVKAGDPLMEVETDKATMEVEAQADGFLSDVRARAGEDVPVGNVVAVIADSADAVVTGNADDGGTAQAEPAGGDDAALPQGAQVIMPALGMAQDTGLIVAWLKAPGEAVGADDVLLEVETDKSTMEVSAGHDGYVAALLAKAGEDVPVGQPIAVISTAKPDAPVQRSIKAGATAPQPDAAAPGPAAEPATPAEAPERPQRPATPQSARGGRVLASPKARRLAAEQGLDLARLREAGYPEPYHVADLDTLRALPAPAAQTATGAAAQESVSATVTLAGLTAFIEWMATETGEAADAAALWAALATAALRTARPETDGPLAVRVESHAARRAALFADADFGGLRAKPAGEDSPAAPGLVVRDLTGTRITGARLAAGAIPVLTVTETAGGCELRLDVAAGALDPDAAITLMSELAARVEDPMRQLL